MNRNDASILLEISQLLRTGELHKQKILASCKNYAKRTEVNLSGKIISVRKNCTAIYVCHFCLVKDKPRNSQLKGYPDC